MPEYLSPGVYVEEVPSAVKPIAGVGTSTAGFVGVASEAKGPILCTNWGEFTKAFGDFAADKTNNLAHGVFGFFLNGGTRCYVQSFTETTSLTLDAFGAIDEIALVAAPGITDDKVQKALVSHCELLQDRFAILDGPSDLKDKSKGISKDNLTLPATSNYAACYFPWIKVNVPGEKEEVSIGPSGHVAGIYARVDAERGVHKAPANEAVRGATGLVYPISKAIQDGLNPDGINCIRDMNGNIRVWGARTIGGDANADLKYVNVRRLLNFLRESIDEGTQWVVFEPNDPSLWAKIERNITAFLTNVWRDGALFGTTPQEAFYVKCDAETNPPEVREQGRVVTEIGVAITKPAEFVIFKLGQWAGPGK